MSYPPCSAKPRVVAAVCVMMTSATTAANGARFPSVDQDSPVSPTWGAPLRMVPITATPWACRPPTTHEHRGPHEADQSAGNAPVDSRTDKHHGKYAEADGRGPPVHLIKVGEDEATRCAFDPAVGGRPRRSGSW